MIPRVAVVGCGQWGANLARNFFSLGALAAVCDENPAVLEGAKALYPGVRLSRTVMDVLEDATIQACVIAVPAARHHDLARLALLAGKDVFVEKPLALRVADGRELVRLALDRQRILMVGHLIDYHPALRRLKQLVDEGRLGKIQYVYSARLNLGRVRTEENILWSFAPHDISVMLRLLGEMPVMVAAHGGSYVNPRIPDVTVTTLTFASGVRGHIFVSWLHPYKEQRLVVVGDAGMAVFDDVASERKLLFYEHRVDWINGSPVARSGEPQVIPVEQIEPLRLECEQFLESIRHRQPPPTDGANGLQVLEILEACQTSLDGEGSPQPLALGENPGYFAHATAVIDEPCIIGHDTKIWHFSHVMPNARIGSRCTIGQNVLVGSRVEIGDNVKIQNNVSVYEGVVLEDDVFCGPSAVFTNVVNPRSHVPRRTEFRATRIRRGATIGANATVVCGVTVGRYAFVGAGAVVTHDVPDYTLVLGVPARPVGFVCQCGVRLALAMDDDADACTCEACGTSYRRAGQGLKPGGGEG